MKVRITKASDEDYWYANRIGEVFEVVALSNSNYKELSKSTPYIVYTIPKQDCEEVTVEQPKKTMNLKEALKAMLEGKIVVISEKQWDGYKFSYSDTFNHFVVTFRGDTIEATALKYYCNKQFELYEPPAPHKYSVDQFVYTGNIIGKIKSIAGHIKDKPAYDIQVSSSGTTYKYTEDVIGGLA